MNSNIQDGSLGIQSEACGQLGLQGEGSLSKSPDIQRVGSKLVDEAKSSSQPSNGKRGRPKKGKSTLRNLVGSARVLRARSQEKSKAPEQINGSAEDAVSRRKRRKKKKQHMKEIPNDEFSKIRRHLRYFLTRINYEQNLIDAYLGEGWKGQSLEKIRPEKELERAKSEIVRRKLKIRDLFQRIYVSCAEGRLPETLFDDQGEIDSEDIFCAKCGSKEVQLDNDIILCDGDCERGFHQFCLVPPLLKEQVPPGDQGWLCPACDCKVDCIDLLNESQGTNLSMSDHWEKVFPEAAAAGNKLDDLGLSSDDSEDETYDPDGPALEDEVEGDESSSDDSDFSSASEDLGDVTNNEQYMGLPSDDSEDDDYNPDKVVSDEQVTEEVSGSDFTSDSEDDVSALMKDAEASTEALESLLSDQIKANGKIFKVYEAKRDVLSDEKLTILGSDKVEGDSAVQSGKEKRHVERLDYKKLYDEEYGCDASSDTSDEDYSNAATPKKRENITERAASVPTTWKISMNGMHFEKVDMKQNEKQSDCTPKKRTGKTPDVEGKSTSPAKPDKGTSTLGSSSNGKPKSDPRRLGEAATQRLYESFKENQYPVREVKENLAKELSLTVTQVSKWFGNTRWSFNHSNKGMEVGKVVPKSDTKEATENITNSQVDKELEQQSEPSPANVKGKQGGAQSYTSSSSRKRKVKSDNQETDRTSAVDTPKQNTLVDSVGARRSGRIQSSVRTSLT